MQGEIFQLLNFKNRTYDVIRMLQSNLPNFQKYKILMFTEKNAMIDLTEMLHFQIKKMKRQRVVMVIMEEGLAFRHIS